MTPAMNVLGHPLQVCGTLPRTGFFRDGYCHTGPSDTGSHVVCAQVTSEFLAFTKSQGNDLSTPALEFGFPGLQPGDHWCLCALRWKEALLAGVAPPVFLAATHEAVLHYVSLKDLLNHALDRPESPASS
ncbi:DUF2237 family protein [Desulfonatronum thioautotrophicum]|uniref:DUF2237 family protein n=1 Tax=Desulfonatronum thioautotrophicum TaxID=617001 RepID=UPI0005EB39D7|nr:DUF2237 domain-containing protein [Desulfonatronum thioautotrophicum]